jgi:hypothetical protein
VLSFLSVSLHTQGQTGQTTDMDGGGIQAEAAGKGGGGGEAEVTLEELRKRMADFAKERDWDQFHSPRNLLLAMVRHQPFSSASPIPGFDPPRPRVCKN